MSLRKTIAAVAAVGALTAALPLTASAATFPSTLPNPLAPNPNLCLSGIPDAGPFGPLGPYGPSGPYGADGPLHNQANPLGNAATCGGLLTYVLRGGTLSSFVNASIGQ